MEFYVCNKHMNLNLNLETAGSPVVLLGDMNAQLPGQQNLAVKWYRDRKISNHSLFLHDFLSDPSLVSANFAFKQNVNYTYFSGSSKSYIDHIFLSENIFSNLTECSILLHHPDNFGDHLPLKATVTMSCIK